MVVFFPCHEIVELNGTQLIKGVIIYGDSCILLSLSLPFALVNK